MIRWFFKLIILAVLVALLFGFWLLYKDKTEEEKQEFRYGVSSTVQSAGQMVTEAWGKVVERVQEVFRGGEEE